MCEYHVFTDELKQFPEALNVTSLHSGARSSKVIRPTLHFVSRMMSKNTGALIHLGTHNPGLRMVQRTLRRNLEKLLNSESDWTTEWDFLPSEGELNCVERDFKKRGRSATPYGPVCFGDGVLSFRGRGPTGGWG